METKKVGHLKTQLQKQVTRREGSVVLTENKRKGAQGLVEKRETGEANEGKSTHTRDRRLDR